MDALLSLLLVSPIGFGLAFIVNKLTTPSAAKRKNPLKGWDFIDWAIMTGLCSVVALVVIVLVKLFNCHHCAV